MKDEEDKRVIKEAVKEWMDGMFANFGKFALASIAVAILGLLAYAMLRVDGWHK